MVLKHRNIVAQRQWFSALPEPFRSPAEEVPHILQDEYLDSLENYIGSLKGFLREVQKEEMNTMFQFSHALRDLEVKNHEKRTNRESVVRQVYQEKMDRVREKRAQYREMLFDANRERIRLIDSMIMKRENEDTLRRKLAKLPTNLNANRYTDVEENVTTGKFMFGFSIIAIIIFVIIYAVCTLYGPTTTFLDVGTPNRLAPTYQFYTDAALFVVVGFGFLGTFLRKYQYGSIGFVLFTACFAWQWSIFCNIFWVGYNQSLTGGDYVNLVVSTRTLVTGMHGALAVVISAGAILGTKGPLTLLIIAFWEVILWSITVYLNDFVFRINDFGGLLSVHLFASYFGIGVSSALCRGILNSFRGTLSPVSKPYSGIEDRQSSYKSDMFAMIGTVVIVVLFPSFNAAMAPDNTQYRVMMNTVMALTSGVVFAFLGSRVFRGGKFRMQDVQNACIAGGVAISGPVVLLVDPGVAMIIGAVGSSVCTLGYAYVSDFLENYFGILDTRGIHNTHGLPALVGTLASIIAAAVYSNNDKDGYVYSQSSNILWANGTDEASSLTLAALFAILVTGLMCGLIIGGLASLGTSAFRIFSDEAYWFVPAGIEVVPDAEMTATVREEADLGAKDEEARRAKN